MENICRLLNDSHSCQSALWEICSVERDQALQEKAQTKHCRPGRDGRQISGARTVPPSATVTLTETGIFREDSDDASTREDVWFQGAGPSDLPLRRPYSPPAVLTSALTTCIHTH